MSDEKYLAGGLDKTSLESETVQWQEASADID